LLRAQGMTTRAFLSGASGNDLSAFANGFEFFESCAGDMATATAAWDSLTQHRSEEPERPLFLWLHLSEIAPPLDPGSVVSVVSTRDFRNWFDEERVVPAMVEGTDLAFGSVEHLDAVTRGELSLTEPERRRLISLYDGEISRGIQILRVFLERYAYARPTVGDGGTQWVMGEQPNEEWSNTLLAVCGVQGTLLGEACDAWGTAEDLSDATLNVPLFLHHPNSFTGRRLFDDVVELRDLAPTLLEVFSAKRPKTMEGRSLLALTDSYAPRSFEARPAFALLGRERFSLRNSRWRISFDATESEETHEIDPLCADLPPLRFYEGTAPLEAERLREDVHPDLRESLELRLAERIEREVGLKVSVPALKR
ncbi:MAG: sulfatase/phosphatase domain-containing protein, partial [Planctomycetota bacterium]